MADPPTKRKHSLSDGFAIVGFNPKTSVLDHDGATVGIRGGPNKITIDNNYEKFHEFLSDFVDAIIGIVTTGSPVSQILNPASQAQFTALKTRALNLFGGS